MNSQKQNSNRAAIDEFSTWAVGLGILVFALAPLSIPILVLTAVALVPLVVPLLAVGLVAAVIAGPVILGRRLARRLRRRQRDLAPEALAPTGQPDWAS